MNVYAFVILATLLAATILDVVADLLNLRALSPVVPAELEDTYDAHEYGRSQAYERARAHFGFLVTGADLAVTLLFWFSGGFEWLDGIVRGWGWNPVYTGVAYIGILALAKALFDLPFGAYGTFVIEERFGFNRTTVRTYLLDLLKSAGLALLLGVPLLAGVLWFFEYAGGAAWLYCWVAVAAFTAVMQYVAPTWIMPLFNRFKPLEDGTLKSEILRLVHGAGFPVQGVFVMDGSRRSAKANAFFTGFGRHKRIVLFDTLVHAHPIPELVAVLAHEIGHYKRRHILAGTLVNVAQTGAMFFVLSLFVHSEALAQAFRMQHVSVYAGMLFFSLLYTPVSLLLSIGIRALSRRHEFSADRFAVRICEEPAALSAALKRLSLSNLSNVTPHPFYVALHYSHPPLIARLKAIGEATDQKTRGAPHRKRGISLRLRDIFS